MKHKKLEYPSTGEAKKTFSKYEEVQFINMSPLQFLGLAAPLGWTMPKYRYECNRNGETDCLKIKAKDADFIYRIRWNVDKIKKQSNVMDTPFLAVCHTKYGKKIVGHEGRHRMIGAYLAGVEQVEVEIEHRFEDAEGYCRRWRGEKIIPIDKFDIEHDTISNEVEDERCKDVRAGYEQTLKELKFILTRKYKDPTRFKKGDIVSLTHRGLQTICNKKMHNYSFCEKYKLEEIPISGWIVDDSYYSGDYYKIKNPKLGSDFETMISVPVSHITLHKRGE